MIPASGTANTIRLSIFARRREIEVMKLVGATNWFVRGPFMLEGLICGLVGSLVAIILLLLIGPVGIWYAQSELNKAWAAEGGPVPQKDEMPAHLDSGPSGSGSLDPPRCRIPST